MHYFRLYAGMGRNRPENRNWKNGAFQPEVPGKFPVEPGKTGTEKIELFNRKYLENSRLNRGKPEPKK